MQYWEPEILGNIIWHKSGDGGQWAKREDVEKLQAQLDRAIKELANIDGENYCPERLWRRLREVLARSHHGGRVMDNEASPNKTVERVIHGVRQDVPNPEYVQWVEVQLQRKQAQLDRAICAWTDMHWKYREIVNLLDGIEPARWDYQLPEYEKKRKYIMEGE
jgi:hypothetical protein